MPSKQTAKKKIFILGGKGSDKQCQGYGVLKCSPLQIYKMLGKTDSLSPLNVGIKEIKMNA